ncbi:hybrid sensor histidine kinase/response regulator [Ramlibacter alkalitolerans]|uniref:histidine kinase n=1 Tax=Ramlibacter alkalitolerans TaxID=2039631 RepID=A0ABS1JRB8_9BURK|nr:response regulator [Ramlibacter alkalitolerans]MBL0426753.1 response regulator [Ramlibacter alkalitolerans]
MISAEAINVTIDRGAHTVLVVDDNPATRYSTGRLIRAAGFQTVEAGSGAEALALIAQGVSAVVLDVHLPDIDGFELCRMIRAQPVTALLPVVHLSAAYVRDEDRVTGLNAGADAYLVHPVEPAVLVATLQALIRARLAEDQLRRSEQRFRAIYDQAQSGIALLDEEARFADANPAMLRMLGRSREALMGVALSELVPAEWRERVQAQLATPAQDRPPWRGEFPLLAANGEPVHLEWSVSSHVEPGVRIAIAIDVSARYELEQRRRELLEREQAARQLAEHHSRTKDDFIAVLSHELRTPLNAIVGWVHILKRRGTTPEGAKGLDAIERNVKTQARIISDILDVARINSGKLHLDREWTDPAELVTASIGALAGSIDERRLQVETEVDGAHATAFLDPARFQQIVWNLMTNAIKFSPEGGRVLVGLQRTGERLQLSVQDFGQGIKPDFLPYLFDRFAQSDSPGNRRHGGLGLGLSIVKHLVDLHGGRVSAHSAGEGHGTRMQVDLPAVPVTDTAEFADTTGGELHEEIEGTPLQGLDVLLVEDDAEASEILGVVLADRGARVRSARDYDSALQAMQQAWPDVLVSDIGLPGRDGYELVRRVRELEGERGGAHLPVIALTAFARPQDLQKTLAAGFDLHLSKPLKPHKLVEAITRSRQPGANA